MGLGTIGDGVHNGTFTGVEKLNGSAEYLGQGLSSISRYLLISFINQNSILSVLKTPFV